MANPSLETENLAPARSGIRNGKMSMVKHPVDWEEGTVPRSSLFNDTFYSRRAGQAETAYVFIEANRLPQRWKGPDHFSIAELGFGTGLNFLETWRCWIAARSATQHLLFTSFEAYPISADDMARALAPWDNLGSLSDALIDRWRDPAPLPGQWQMDEQTMLQVIPGEAQQAVADWEGLADAWYLDGFSPASNPDMWSPALLQQVFDHTTRTGSFATYTAAAWVRRNLQAAGFTVSKRKGFAGKREMMFGHK